MFHDLDHNLSAAQFTTRRLPEIKSLWRSFLQQQQHEAQEETTKVQDCDYYQSGGKKISNRHLRRRTTSHYRKQHHRFPQGMKPSTIPPDNKEDNYMKRRKTPPCRKMKRKRSILQTLHLDWQDHTNDDHNDIMTSNATATRNNIPSLLSSSSSQTILVKKNWLATHLWHTKRFHMSPPLLQAYAGFCIPICHNNRDSQAIVRLIRENDKCTIQDVTWMIGGIAILLEQVVPLVVESSGVSNTMKVMEVGTLENITTQQSHTFSFISILKRFCGYEDPSFWMDRDFLTGNKMRYTMIYAVDSFPQGAICPGAFLIHRALRNKQEELTDVHDDTMGTHKMDPIQYTYQVQIFVPPNVISIVLAMIQELCIASVSEGLDGKGKDGIKDSMVDETDLSRTSNDKAQQPCNNSYRCFIQKGCALLQIRGKSASCIMRNILPSFSFVNPLLNGNVHNSDIPIVSGREDYCSNLCHGSVIRGSFHTLQFQVQDETSVKNLNHVSSASMPSAEAHHKSDQKIIRDEIITFIYQSPNYETDISSNRSRNYGFCGWDILCSPTIASDLFYKFNTNEGACAIGMVEYATLLMEADTPLPLWPRDYPDTNTGKEYWSGHNREWNLIRYSLDLGMKGGRIHTGLRHHIKGLRDFSTVNKSVPFPDTSDTIVSHGTITTSLKWDLLIFESSMADDNRDSDLMVLRGSSIEPLKTILTMFHYHSHFNDDTKQTNCNRRPRRPVLQSNHLVLFPPVSKDQNISLRKACSTLLENTSPSAIVRCCIVLENKGVLMSNQTIYEYATEEQRTDRLRLGFVVSGLFSSSRGKEYGMGFVSARKLVEYLGRGKHGICAHARTPINHGPTYFIRATIAKDDDNVGMNAFISLL